MKRVSVCLVAIAICCQISTAGPDKRDEITVNEKPLKNGKRVFVYKKGEKTLLKSTRYNSNTGAITSFVHEGYYEDEKIFDYSIHHIRGKTEKFFQTLKGAPVDVGYDIRDSGKTRILVGILGADLSALKIKRAYVETSGSFLRIVDAEKVQRANSLLDTVAPIFEHVREQRSKGK